LSSLMIRGRAARSMEHTSIIFLWQGAAEQWKEVTTGPKSRNLSDSIILELLDWTKNLPDEISHTNCDRRYEECIFYLFLYLCCLAPLHFQCYFLISIFNFDP
jgi:hypothetical protein